MRDDEAAAGIVAYHTASIANDVRVPGWQAEQVFNVKPCVHAGHNRHVLGRVNRLLSRLGRLVYCLPARVKLIVFQILVCGHVCHDSSISEWNRKWRPSAGFVAAFADVQMDYSSTFNCS